jgi:hypothetical protein
LCGGGCEGGTVRNAAETIRLRWRGGFAPTRRTALYSRVASCLQGAKTRCDRRRRDSIFESRAKSVILALCLLDQCHNLVSPAEDFHDVPIQLGQLEAQGWQEAFGRWPLSRPRVQETAKRLE